jgi:uncharacterized protein (DUF488 family)
MPGNTRRERAPIYTIGYGSRTMEEFVALLKAYDIAFLIDVRSAPYSRFKPEFSREALASHLRAQGLRYIYLGHELGGQPADRDCYVDDRVVYARVAQKEYYREGIRRLRGAFEKGLHVALMCSEGRPGACHRSKLIGQTLAEQAIPVRHIDENGELRTQEEVLLELADGQLSLFDEAPAHLTSRKRYRPRQPEEPPDSLEAKEEEDDDA